MAHPGELIKMADGRWARFSRCEALDPDENGTTLLVAVELPEHHQDLLMAAEQSLGVFRAQGIAVRVLLEPDEKGVDRVLFSESPEARLGAV